MKSERRQIIDAVLADLSRMDAQRLSDDQRYALDATVTFFETMKSWPKHLWWILFIRPKLDGKLLLELSDFGFAQWQKLLQKQLVEIEQWKFPDILAPLRKELIKQIKQRAGSKPLIIANIGCGTMEVERQVIEALSQETDLPPIIFLGLDNSQSSLKEAYKNLQTINHQLITLPVLNDFLLYRLQQESQGIQAYCYRGDALATLKHLKEDSFDLICFSKFKHHLPLHLHKTFENELLRLSPITIEGDDYNGFYLHFFSFLFNWNKPVLSNGAIFSGLRDPKKKALRQEKRAPKPGQTTMIIPLNGYVRIYERV